MSHRIRTPQAKREKLSYRLKFRKAFALHQQGKIAGAERLYKEVLRHETKHFDALHLLGVIAIQSHRVKQGIDLITKAIEINPNAAAAYNNLGNGLFKIKRHNEAIANFDKALALKPDFADAHHNRGAALNALKRYEEAVISFEKALALHADSAPTYYELGVALNGIGRHEDAITSYNRTLKLKPDFAKAYNNRGNALNALRRHQEALLDFDKAIAISPSLAEAYNNLGASLNDLKRHEEAIANFDRALALKPSFSEAYYNRGNALNALKRHEAAIADFDRALAIKPDFVKAYNNRGVALNALSRYSEALASFDQAALLKQDYAETYWNKGLVKLLTGNFLEGWKLYEWGWKGSAQRGPSRHFPQPLWLGEEPISGKTILIHAEQGLGDTIQFCRYVPMVKALGARIIFEVPTTLAPLISKLKCDCLVINKGGKIPNFDFQCPLMSLPLAFKTTLQTIPAVIPYLYAETNKTLVWKQKLGKSNRPRVGLAWSGKATHLNDYYRSMAVETLRPILSLPFEFHSLQKEYRDQDSIILEGLPQIKNHCGELSDFSDTTALVSELDVIISVDTAVAHLAGALGKTTWVLLPFSPDYRWLLDRTDSPWYPTATLFRQTRVGDWKTVVEKVSTELQKFAVQRETVAI